MESLESSVGISCPYVKMPLTLNLHSPLLVPTDCSGSSSAHPPAPPIHRRCFFTRKLFTSCALIADTRLPEFFSKAFACLISFGSLGHKLANVSFTKTSKDARPTDG